MRSEKARKSILGRVIKTFLLIILIPVLAVAALAGYLTVSEYKPEAIEQVEISRGAEKEALDPTKIFTVMSWNIGYGDLGDNADYFFDGGKSVINSDETRLDFNMDNIISQIGYQHPEIVFVQEVDRDSRRSHHVNELEWIKKSLSDMDFSFGANYVVDFVPYPWPPLGKIDSGIATGSKVAMTESVRYQFPHGSEWPMSTVYLKRCFTASRLPIQGSDKELIAVNLHMEAYDEGDEREAEIKVLMDFLNREYEAGNYIIAGGDFNQVFSNTDTSKFPVAEGAWENLVLDVTKYGENWQFLMDSEVPSCRYLSKPYEGSDPETFQYYVIDGFILSDNIEVKEFEVKDIGFVYTDHNPLVLKVKLKA